jgi:hypothetical protein
MVVELKMSQKYLHKKAEVARSNVNDVQAQEEWKEAIKEHDIIKGSAADYRREFLQG